KSLGVCPEVLFQFVGQLAQSPIAWGGWAHLPGPNATRENGTRRSRLGLQNQYTDIDLSKKISRRNQKRRLIAKALTCPAAGGGGEERGGVESSPKPARDGQGDGWGGIARGVESFSGTPAVSETPRSCRARRSFISGPVIQAGYSSISIYWSESTAEAPSPT